MKRIDQLVTFSVIVFRAAQLADAESISRLLYYLSEKFIIIEFSDQGKAALLKTLSADAIYKNIKNNFRYHVAELDGDIIGVIAMKENQHLYHLFVAESQQGKGVAKSLWHTAKKACLEAEEINQIFVNSSLNAVSFYEQLGFKKQSARQNVNGICFVPMKYVV